MGDYLYDCRGNRLEILPDPTSEPSDGTSKYPECWSTTTWGFLLLMIGTPLLITLIILLLVWRL